MASKPFWDLWTSAEPGSEDLKDMVKKALDFLCITRVYWEVRVFDGVSEELQDTDAITSSPHGNEIFILLNRASHRMVEDVKNSRGDYLAATILHEILHVFLWDIELAFVELEDDAYKVLYTFLHSRLDRLARVLIPAVYPDLKQGVLSNEQVDSDDISGSGGSGNRKPRKSRSKG